MKIKMYSRPCLHHSCSNTAHCANINTSHAFNIVTISILYRHQNCINILILYQCQNCININIVPIPILLQYQDCINIKIVSISISYQCQYCANFNIASISLLFSVPISNQVMPTLYIVPISILCRFQHSTMRLPLSYEKGDQ